MNFQVKEHLRICACTHVGGHHGPGRYDVEMTGSCTWKGCGCPKFVWSGSSINWLRKGEQ